MTDLRAGVGRISLTPALGTALVGFAGREPGCTSIHDDILATALVLDDGTTQVAVVSCDLLAIHPELVRATRALVEQSCGIAGEHVMLCCSHTHSGPPAYVSAGARPIDQEYAASLPARIAEAVEQATATLAPARIGSGQGRGSIALNRRWQRGQGQPAIGENPDGPVDDTLGVLVIERPDGSPCATIVNYACHPVILRAASRAVSADFVGQARAVVERATGTHVLFVQGACADLNPVGGVQHGNHNLERLGSLLADEILGVCAAIHATSYEARLAVSSDDLIVSTAPLAHPLPLDGPPLVSERFDLEFPWCADRVDDDVRIAVQAIAIGDLAIVGVGCEPFTQTGMRDQAAIALWRNLRGGLHQRLHRLCADGGGVCGWWVRSADRASVLSGAGASGAGSRADAGAVMPRRA